MKLKTIRLVALTAALVLLSAGATFAEDDPLRPPVADDTATEEATESGPATGPAIPAVSETKNGSATKPGASATTKSAPAADDGWGAPSTSPAKDMSTDLLPPPTIRNPRTGQTTGGVQPATGSIPNIPYTVPSDPSLTPMGTSAPNTGGTTRTGPSTARVIGAPASPRGQIVRMTKTHNVPMPDQGLALRIDVEFSTAGMRGQSVKLAAAFARADTGATIRSLVPAFAGASGNVIARTAPVTVQVDNGRFRASLWVPYGAFPTAAPGASYSVRSLVQLQSGDGARVLAHANTSFTVHGPTAQ